MISDAKILTYDPEAVAAEAPKTRLFAALAAAQQRCRAVEKDSQNTFHRYNYASSEALIGEAKKALEGSGLSFMPLGSILSEEPGKAAVLMREFLLAHESGETMHVSTQWPVVPDKGRPLDKAVASAATTSLAYLLRDLLLMPRVDESDDMDSPRRDEQPRARGRETAGATGSRRAARPEAQQDHATAVAGDPPVSTPSPTSATAAPTPLAVLAELRAAASRLTDSQEDLDLTIKSGELGKSILGSLGNRDAWRETGKLDGIAANGRQLRDFLTKLAGKVTA